MNSVQNDSLSLKYLSLHPFIIIPRVMWPTPNITAVFILKEFMYIREFSAMYQAESIPKERWQPGMRTSS